MSGWVYTNDPGIIAIPSVFSPFCLSGFRLSCQPLCFCARVCVCSEGTHLVADRESQMYEMYSWASGVKKKNTHTAAHCLWFSDTPFPSKVNSRRRRRNVRPRRDGVLTAGGLHSHTAATVASLRAFPRQQHVCLLIFLSVPPAASTPCPKKGQGCWRAALCLAPLTCELSQTQRQTTELRGKIWRLFVLCGCCCFAVRYVFSLTH